MPYAVSTHAPRPSCFLTEFVVVDDWVGETTGARSSMQKPPDGKIVAQCTVCVTPARIGAGRTI